MQPRVLIECGVPLAALDRMDALERAGFQVDWCSGPDHHHCPVLDGISCQAVAAADVVITALGADALDVAVASAVVHPDVPQVTLLPRFVAREVADAVHVGTVIPEDAGDTELIAAVNAAMADWWAR